MARKQEHLCPQRTHGNVQRRSGLSQLWGAAGIRRVEARGAAYVLHEVEQPPQQRIIQLHVSVLPRLRNLRLNTHVSREGQG